MNARGCDRGSSCPMNIAITSRGAQLGLDRVGPPFRREPGRQMRLTLAAPSVGRIRKIRSNEDHEGLMFVRSCGSCSSERRRRAGAETAPSRLLGAPRR